MSAFESFALAYLLNSMWQVPLVFAVAWIVTRALRRSGPAFEHRVWVAALALEALLPACSISPARLSRLFFWSFIHHGANAHARVTITAGPAYARGQLQLPPHLLSVIVLVYAGTLAWFASRLLWGLWKTSVLHRRAQRIVLTGHSREIWARFCNLFAVHAAELATLPEIACPMTIGIRRRIVLLPADLPASLRDDDLNAAIAHEFAHMRRRDLAKNLFYAALSLSVAYHPLLWLTRTRLEESREMVCDTMATEAVAGSQSYARSLLRLASVFAHQTPSPTLHAIGIFDANIFERRIMNLTRKHTEVRGLRLLLSSAACVIIAAGTCASAMALRMNVAAPASANESQQASQSAASAPVSGRVIAGNRLNFVEPVYPPKAKAAKRNGIVVLDARIGKDGKIDKLKVASGPEIFRSSALTAVGQWTYKPFLLHGEPTSVDTTITVTYQCSR